MGPDDLGSKQAKSRSIFLVKGRAAPFILTMVKAAIDKLGSAKRFGARYGTKPKYIFAKIEKEQRRLHKCPYCLAVKVKRAAVGIWQCRKCNIKFTGKAYSIKKTVFIDEAQPDEEAPAEEDDLEEESDEQTQ